MKTQEALKFIRFPIKHLIDFVKHACLSVCVCLPEPVFALLLIHFVSVHARPSTDTRESRAGEHVHKGNALAEEICEKEGEEEGGSRGKR